MGEVTVVVRMKPIAAMKSCVVLLAVALAAPVATAQAAPGDVATPAGPGIGSIVVFVPVVDPASGLATPRSMILLPTPATGSLVLALPAPPVSGSGPSIARYVLVIPGPNPAQNTGVALGLQLTVTLGANGVVTVYPISGP